MRIHAVTVDDVAAYILAHQGSMTAMKLQKLVYYSQAWSLVWDEATLFEERIEAWANGPVCPALWEHHRGRFKVEPPWQWGDAGHLAEPQRDTVEAVLRFYGDKSAQWLSDLAHSEGPWVEARGELPPGVRGNRVIALASMAEYYEAISHEDS